VSTNDDDPRLADELPNLPIDGLGSPELPFGVLSITLEALAEATDATWDETRAGVDP